MLSGSNASDLLDEIGRLRHDIERLTATASVEATENERLRAALTGWESYAWKNGQYIDSIQEYFDAVLRGDEPQSDDAAPR